MSIRVEATRDLSPAQASDAVRGERAVAPAGALAPEGETSAVGGAAPVDFATVLGGVVHDAATTQAQATAKADALARGASDDLHGTMLTMKEAEISMKLVGSIRNKLLDAFHELWRTSV